MTTAATATAAATSNTTTTISATAIPPEFHHIIQFLTPIPEDQLDRIWDAVEALRLRQFSFTEIKKLHKQFRGICGYPIRVRGFF